MEPGVTIIMSAYNHEQYVEQAIQSVLAQTYQGAYFIAADDASTDNTAAILMKYEEQIDELHLYDLNSGSSRGRDLIFRVRTEYTAMINSDDYWERDKLEKQVRYLEEHPECAACFTWCNEIDEDGNDKSSGMFQQKNKTKEEWMRFFWENGNCLAHPSILIRTKVYQEVTKENTALFRQLSDYYRWLLLVQKYELHIIEEKLINFRYHDSAAGVNVSMPNNENMIRDAMEQSYMWYKIMLEMDDQYFRNAFADILKDKEASSHEQILCEKYFVLASSPILGVAQASIYFYYEVFRDIEVYQVLMNNYGFYNKDFYSKELQIGFPKLICDVDKTNKKILGLMDDITKKYLK